MHPARVVHRVAEGRVPGGPQGVAVTARLPPDPPTTFIGRVLLVVVTAALLLLAVRLHAVFMLIFGAVILATALDAGSRRLERWLHLSHRAALLLAVAALIVGIVGGGWLVGDRLAGELANLRERLPLSVEAARQWVQAQVFGAQALALWHDMVDGGIPWARLAGAATLTFGALGSLLLMVVLAVYLAADPVLYRDGTVRLFPIRHRARVQEALQAARDGLSRWLLGQSVSMLFVGLSTAIGLAALGMPLAFTLGAIAGVTGFIPFFGAIASGVLAVLVAFSEGPAMAFYVTLLAVAIQQIDNDVLMPMVQRRTVSLPPVLGLVAVLVFGLLFGVMGTIFATPLMVVVMILVQRLYVEGLLEASQSAPGPDDAEGRSPA